MLEQYSYERQIQRIAFGVSFLQSRISIDNLVLWVSFATFRCKEANEIEIADSDWRLRCNVDRSYIRAI